MSYDAALLKAWKELEDCAKQKKYSVRFLADEYSVGLEDKSVMSLSCDVPAKPSTSVFLLHYLRGELKGLNPPPSGKWISFNDMEGGQFYYSVFKKRVLDVIIRKYGKNPEGILDLIDRFKAKKGPMADFSVILDAFEKVPVLIELWKGDEEFGPEANILFDENIKDIFDTEEVVVMAETIVHNI